MRQFRYISFVLSLCFACSALGQVQKGLPSTLLQPAGQMAVNSSQYFLVIETEATDIGQLLDADLTGYNTYRIYVHTAQATDQVSAIYGNIDEPSQLFCSGDIFQSSPLGGVTPEGITPDVWGAFPSNQYDSFVTIGIDEPALNDAGEGDINIIESTVTPWTELFEPEGGDSGSGIMLTDITGGSWFALPNFSNGIAGEDQQVLVAQITTNGTLTGNLNAQIFIDGDNINGTVYLDLPLPILGCTDESAANFNADADQDDGSCTSSGCLDPNAANFNANATTEDGSCQHLCIGLAGCTYPDAENYNPAANCENGTCTYDLTDTAGNCAFDHDDNGSIGSSDLIYFLSIFGSTCSE